MELKKNYPLKEFNTFGLDAVAPTLISCSSISDVQEVIQNEDHDVLNAFILGGGSNILLTNNPKGLVLKMDIHGKEVIREDDSNVWIRCGAGENWHQFVLFALENNWGGIENLSLIPGTVGAAPMQNIGAYGTEVEGVFDHLRAVNKENGQLETFDRDTCRFGYRESVFKNDLKNRYIICDVTFRLNKPPHEINSSYGAIQDTLGELNIEEPTIQDISKAVISIRQSKLPDPAEIGNSGSFFKNPTISKETFDALKLDHPDIPGYPVGENAVKVPAGWLIEQCGWKGYTRNSIGVHRMQALVLVNYGGGQGTDVWQLAQEIRSSVADKYGIDLQPEVNVI